MLKIILPFGDGVITSNVTKAKNPNVSYHEIRVTILNEGMDFSASVERNSRFKCLCAVLMNLSNTERVLLFISRITSSDRVNHSFYTVEYRNCYPKSQFLDLIKDWI